MAMFQILGPVRLSASGHNADLGSSAKVRGLLGILLLAADSAVSIDQIVDRLWDPAGEAPPNPRKTVQGYVSKLKAHLKKAAAPATIISGRGYYRLQIDPDIVDYHRFRHLSGEGRTAARQGDHARAVTALEAAIDLWHGQPLADIRSSWATRYGETLVNQDLLPAYQALLDAQLELGNYDDVLTRLAPLLRDHETNESLIGLRMRALAAVDGPSSVVACFLDFTAKLSEVLDASPTEGLVQLYQSLIRQPEPIVATTVRRPPLQLPRDIPNFVGRVDILRQLDDLLTGPDSSPAVVSLDGAPGVGKTAIATHWANRDPALFADGVLYADLNGYGPGTPTSAATVLATFLYGLGIEDLPKDVSERASLLRRELTGRRVLVILDNALDSASVRPLLTATSPSPLLITSRQRLTGLAYRDSAHCITVPTLMIDESIALLQLRIGHARVADDLPAVHDLATLCSGTPLALRIAGEHVAARPEAPIPDLVQHLRSHHRLLDAGSHGDDDSTKLRAVFDWSANALPPDAEHLFRLLGLHPSTQVSTQAAAALAGWGIECTELAFDALVGAHLAQQHGADTYRLHDLLHVYASDRAHSKGTPAECAAAIHRLVDWYLHTAANAVSKVAPQRRPVPSLALGTPIRPQTFDDAQEALRWCIRERSQVLAVSRCAIDNGFHDHVWRLIGTFDEILNRFGDPRDTIDVHRAALESARITGSHDGEAGSLNNVGVLHFYLGDYENAAHYYTEALAKTREIGDEFLEAASLFNLGTTHLMRELYPQAVEFYQQALVKAERLDEKDVQARVYHRLGEVHQRWEQFVEAESYYKRSLAIREQYGGDARNQASTLTKLGELCAESCDLQKAIYYAERALDASRDSYDHRKAAEALLLRATVRYRLGAHDEAIASAQEAAVLSHTMSDPLGEARALEILSLAQQAIGDSGAADHSRTKALSLIGDSNDPIISRIRAAASSTATPAQEIPDQRAETIPRPVGPN